MSKKEYFSFFECEKFLKKPSAASPCTFFANTQGNGNDGAMRIS